MTYDKVKIVAGYVKLGLAVIFTIAFLYVAITSEQPFGLHDLLAIMGMLGFAASGGESTLQGNAMRSQAETPPHAD